MFEDFNVDEIKRLSEMVFSLNHSQYQLNHKKVKYRYTTPKFYMNNFKRNSRNNKKK